MHTTPLEAFVAKVTRSNRVLYADFRRLRRDILPAGPTSRAEVEALLGLDRIEQTEEDWPAYLTRTVADFVLAEAAPDRQGSPDATVWLAEALSKAQPRTAAAIVRTLAGEGVHLDEALIALMGRGPKRPKEQSLPAPAPA